MDEYRSRNSVPPDCTGRSILAALLGIAVFILFGWLSKLVVGQLARVDPQAPR